MDAITYSVQGRTPHLRLKTEKVMGDGKKVILLILNSLINNDDLGRLCGSSFINERFKKHLEERLDGETYLETGDTTIDQIIESREVMGEFEHRVKRQLTFENQSLSRELFSIGMLKENLSKGFRKGHLEVKR